MSSFFERLFKNAILTSPYLLKIQKIMKSITLERKVVSLRCHSNLAVRTIFPFHRLMSMLNSMTEHDLYKPFFQNEIFRMKIYLPIRQVKEDAAPFHSM